MRPMLFFAVVVGLWGPSVVASAQDAAPDLSVRQVEAIHEAGEPAPPPTEDLSPAADGRQVVLRGEDGRIYELGPTIVTEDHVRAAEPRTDGRGGWAAVVRLTDPAASRFAALTSQLACLRERGEEVRSRLAVVVDGVVVSAARIQGSGEGDEGVLCGTGITGGQLAISTGSRQEAFELAEAFGWTDEDRDTPAWLPLLLVGAIFAATAAVAFRRVRKPLGRSELGDHT